MSSREAILQKIREQNKGSSKKIEEVHIQTHIVNTGNQYENFKINLINNKSSVHECKKGQLDEKIKEILLELESKKIMFGDGLPVEIEKLKYNKLHFNKSINEIYNEAFESDTSIIEASAGVSNFGVLCVVSSKTQPRLLSLLPANCIVLLQKDKIVESLNDAFNEVTKDSLPTNIVFIIGPSRTADIELIPILGVHGPRNLHVVLYY